jgi:lipopolysaccharide transport system ATP-binding protein
MSTYPIEFDGVWKKFLRGERFDSLRDLIPSLARSMFSRNQTELQEKEFWALQDVSFKVAPGESLAIIGPNGSGKSTALKLLSGILKPDKGSLHVRGRMGTLIELGAGFHPDLTGRENVYLNGTILGMTKAEIDKKFDAIVEFSELKAFLDTPVKRYSSGMYARLGFAVAAHVEPEVLIVDEVLSVGDYHFQQRCFDKMQEFLRNGTSVVFVSHNMSAVSSLCKKGLLLRKGVPVYLGDISTAIQKYHSFYEEETTDGCVELLDARLLNSAGEETELIQPGEEIRIEIKLRAKSDFQDAHAAILIRTEEGQFVFDTATSRLLSEKRLNLRAGETARVAFSLKMNLQSGSFLIGFTVTSEIEVVGQFMYYNGKVKRVVMATQRKSNGIVYLDPRAVLSVE